MEIQDIRRARLAQLIQERYGGSQARFIDETGENQSEVSGLLRAKSFGERKARKLEVKCSLPVGWFDVEQSSDESAKSEAQAQSRQRPTLTVVETAEQKWMALVYVTHQELDLLTQYRQATEVGKGLIEIAAQSAAGDELGAGSAHQS